MWKMCKIDIKKYEEMDKGVDRFSLMATAEDTEARGLLGVNNIALVWGSSSDGAEVAATEPAELDNHSKDRHDNEGRQEGVLWSRKIADTSVDIVLGVDEGVGLGDETGLGKEIDTGNERVGTQDGRADNDGLLLTDEAQDESDDCKDSQQDGTAGRGVDETA